MSSVVSPELVADVVKGGGVWSRAQIAEEIGREKTTHVIAQIERAWGQRLIEKVWGWIGNQMGWLYYDADEMGTQHVLSESFDPRDPNLCDDDGLPF
jgi:hypothetical protein